MITLDASGVVALLNPGDRFHTTAARTLVASSTPVVPAQILSELTFAIARQLGEWVVAPFLRGFETGSPLLDCADTDLPRIVELLERYADQGLGFADAAVVACAERHGGQILSFDRRELDVVARDVPITIVP